MSARRLNAGQRGELRRRIGLLAEGGLTEAEAAEALGIPRTRYRDVQAVVGVWHVAEAARMREAQAAWRLGRSADARGA